MPSFKCKDIGLECPFEVSALTKGGLIRKISKHTSEVHQLGEVPADMMQKIEKAIK